jgi:hypothetical protein
MPREIAFFDVRIRPNVREHLIFRYQSAPIFDQKAKQFEFLQRHRHRLSVVPQNFSFRIDLKFTEFLKKSVVTVHKTPLLERNWIEIGAKIQDFSRPFRVKYRGISACCVERLFEAETIGLAADCFRLKADSKPNAGKFKENFYHHENERNFYYPARKAQSDSGVLSRL